MFSEAGLLNNLKFNVELKDAPDVQSLGKKVVFISATPINNYTSDIENQLYLFCPME